MERHSICRSKIFQRLTMTLVGQHSYYSCRKCLSWFVSSHLGPLYNLEIRNLKSISCLLYTVMNTCIINNNILKQYVSLLYVIWTFKSLFMLFFVILVMLSGCGCIISFFGITISLKSMVIYQCVSVWVSYLFDKCY